MRKDPIISEDWKIGSTDYFKYSYMGYFDFVLTLLISLWSILISFDARIFVQLIVWVFFFVFLIFVELILDQKERSISNRLLILIVLFLLIFVSDFKFDNFFMEYLYGILVVMKLINAPIQNYILTFHDEILVPNMENVGLVLKDHISRFSETDYKLETNEEFQSRINSSSISFMKYFVFAIIVSIILFIFLRYDQEYGIIVGLGILSITSLSFTYTVSAWYFNRRIELRDKVKEKEIGDDPIFPEQLD